MRRFLAYMVMILTMLGAIIFNTQAVMENKTDAMEYGPGTELVYSLEQREATDYDVEKYPDIKANGTKKLTDIDIEKEVMDRLDTAGVRNANVQIVQGKNDSEGKEVGYQLRVSLSPLSDTELNNVKEILGYTGTLAISTIGDTATYYDANSEFFYQDGDIATITYNGTTPYPTLHVKDQDSFDALKKAAKEASDNKTKEARRYFADGDDSSSDKNTDETTVYLWKDKTVDDTYDKAFGTHDTIVMDEVKEKVIAKIDLNNFDSENLALPITSDIDGNAWTISTARAFVNMLNATDYGFSIHLLYSNNISATFGYSALNMTYLIFGIVLLVFCVLLIVFYGLAGITASVSMLGSVLFTFFLSFTLGFEFSVAALGGIAIIAALSMFISVNYYERVKAEMRKGKDVEKANKEGYHKSYLVSLDVSLIALIISIFSFLIANGSYKTFFGFIMVGAVVTFLVTDYLDKWMNYWLVKDSANSKLPFFSFSKTKAEKKNVAFASADKKHFSRKMMILLPSIAALCLGIGFPLRYALGGSPRSFFSNSQDFANTYTLNITYRDNSESYQPLSTKENFLEYVVAMGTSDTTIGSYQAISVDEKKSTQVTNTAFFYYDASKSNVNIVEKKDEEGNAYYMTYYSLNVDRDLAEVIDTNGNSVLYTISTKMRDTTVVVEEKNGDSVIGTTSYSPMAGDAHGVKDSLVVNSYLTYATNVSHTTNTMILIVYLISVFSFVYLFLRYGLNVSLAGLTSGTLMATLGLGLLSLLPIPYTSYTPFALLISLTLLNLLFVPVLGRNRETLKERKIRKTATLEERTEIANESARRALWMVLPVLGITLIYAFALAFINKELLGLSLGLILFTLLDFVVLYFFAVPFYVFLASHISFRRLNESFAKRREARRAKKNIKKVEEKKVAGPDGIVYVDDGPHETIIPGLNDFRHSQD